MNRKDKKKVYLGLISGFFGLVLFGLMYASVKEASAHQKHVDLMELCWLQTGNPECL